MREAAREEAVLRETVLEVGRAGEDRTEGGRAGAGLSCYTKTLSECFNKHAETNLSLICPSIHWGHVNTSYLGL